MDTRTIAALVAAVVVYAVVHPVNPNAWPQAYRVAAYVIMGGLVIMANNTTVSIVAAMGIIAIAMHSRSDMSRIDHADGRTRASSADVRERFTTRAPHLTRAPREDDLPGKDSGEMSSANARVSFGAGSELPLPDPGMSVEDLKTLTPPELLEAAQSNEVPNRGRFASIMTGV